MPVSVDHYAYHAEAALDLFTDAHLMRQDADQRERLLCGLFARSARCALVALCAAQGLSARPSSLNLLSFSDRLQRCCNAFGRRADQAEQHARRLSRVLILDQHDAGRGYVTRDLFGADDVMTCEAAALFFVDLCCRRLLGCNWEQALIRFMPFRETPMTDTVLWQRRRAAGHDPLRGS